MRRDKLVGVFAESFSQKPFDPVADVGFSVFFADAYSHPRPFGGEIEDRKRGSITPLPFGKEFLKLFVFFHSEIAHEAPDRSAKTSASAADVLKIRNPTKKACGFCDKEKQRKSRPRSSGELLSSFISSSLQNVSSALARHSLSETVYLASLSLFGLICSLHNFFSYR